MLWLSTFSFGNGISKQHCNYLQTLLVIQTLPLADEIPYPPQDGLLLHDNTGLSFLWIFFSCVSHNCSIHSSSAVMHHCNVLTYHSKAKYKKRISQSRTKAQLPTMSKIMTPVISNKSVSLGIDDVDGELINSSPTQRGVIITILFAYFDNEQFSREAVATQAILMATSLVILQHPAPPNNF